MPDPFELLGVPAQPWLDPQLLQARFDELSRTAHPDAGGDDFAALNGAFATLTDPVTRLKALLERFGQAPAARTGLIDERMVERFMEVGDFLASADEFMARYQAMTTQVARALAAPTLAGLKEKSATYLAEIDVELADQELSLKQLNEFFLPGGEAPTPPMFAVVRTILQSMSFLRKWRGELRERQFSLKNA